MTPALFPKRAALFTRAARVATIASLLLVSLRPTMAAGDLLFSAPYLTLDVGCAPNGLVVGDLNGDGKQDLVAENEASASISVMMGNGDWTFGPRVSYPIGGHPASVAKGDFNGDGSIDLVVLNTGSATTSILLGNGNGTFGPSVNIPNTGPSVCVAVGDLNGDGREDLAVSSVQIAGISILPGNGDGTFGASSNFPTGDVPDAVTIGDLNGDGVPDLAAANQFMNTVSILLGTGGGSFAPATFIEASAPGDVRIADLDADGDADLIVSNSWRLSVFLGAGGGVLGDPTHYTCNGGLLATGDLNHDGNLDLVSAGTRVCVLLGSGDGTFGVATEYAPGGVAPAIADLDGDGKLDLTVANPERQTGPFCPAGTVSMLPGNGDGSFGSPVPLFSTGDSPGSVAVRDLNGDGLRDLVTANSLAGTVSVLLGEGAGAFGAHADFAVGSQPRSIAIDDFNRDGTLDLAVANSQSNTLSVLLGDGNGSFGPKSDLATGPYPVSVATGDLNRDGAPDLVVTANVYMAATVSVLLGNGDGTFGPRIDFGVLPAGHASSVTVGDLNGDGSPDVVVTIVGEWDFYAVNYISVLMGTGNGSFGAPKLWSVGLNPSIVVIHDVNLDGRPDLVVADGGNWTFYEWAGGDGTVSVLLGNGDGTFGAAVSYPTADSPGSLVIGLLDGDDIPDLAVGAQSVSVLIGRGDGTFGERLDYAPGGALAGGDLDGDGKTDLAVTLGATDQVMMLRNISPGGPTATLLSLFHGIRTERGIELRWRFGDPSRFASAEIQRGETANGPWQASVGERWDEAGTSVLLDVAAEPGRVYWYRIVATTRDGATMTFGPLEVEAALVASEFALGPIIPNPARDRVQFGFAVARAARVQLSVVDLQGRRVATLADGVQPPGQYQAAWEGTTGRGRAPAGLYFACLEAAGRRWVRPFVLVR